MQSTRPHRQGSGPHSAPAGADDDGGGCNIEKSPTILCSAIHVRALCVNRPLNEVQVVLVGSKVQGGPFVAVLVLYPLAQLGRCEVREGNVGGGGGHGLVAGVPVVVWWRREGGLGECPREDGGGKET